MELHSVKFATECSVPGWLDLIIDATLDGVRADYPFTYAPDDPSPMTAMIKEYLASHAVPVSQKSTPE